MCNIYFDVFIHNLIKGGFGHTLNIQKCIGEVHTISKRKASFGYILSADLSCKVVQSTKKISMNLLQTLDVSRLCCFQNSTLKELVGFLLTLSVDGIVAVSKPIKKSSCLDVGYCLCLQDYALTIQRICQSLLPVRSLQFELVSATNQFVLLLL